MKVISSYSLACPAHGMVDFSCAGLQRTKIKGVVRYCEARKDLTRLSKCWARLGCEMGLCRNQIP